MALFEIEVRKVLSRNVIEADEHKGYESSNFPKKHIFHSVLALKDILEIYK